jgi:hypothetical protein
MGVRETAVDCLNSIYGEYVAGRLVLKLVSTMRGADREALPVVYAAESQLKRIEMNFKSSMVRISAAGAC